MRTSVVFSLTLCGFLCGGFAAAQTPEPGSVRSAGRASVTLGGYVEALYQWNFNRPTNHITNFRGFDNRGETFTLSNVVLDATGTLGPVSARVALQVGHTPEAYYLQEPDLPGATGAGRSDMAVWKYIQQANVGWRTTVFSRPMLFEAGVFLSPIGPEGMVVHEQWNWSRSNLFFGLPYYHTGARANYTLSEAQTLTLAVYNGWNSVTDNNPEKSLSLQYTYSLENRLYFSAMYFGGVERPAGAAERIEVEAWRSVFDTYITLYPRAWLSLMAHTNLGFEPNAFGTSWWAAGALYARVRARPWLYFALRGEVFYEDTAASARGVASTIFWPSKWVSEATATAEFRPRENLSLRLEYRHDEASGDMYFRGAVATDPLTRAYLPNASSQDTLSLGATAWF